MATVSEILAEAKKALATAVTLEGAAVTLGLLDKQQDAVITAILGAVTTALVYLVRNVPKPAAGKHEAGE